MKRLLVYGLVAIVAAACPAPRSNALTITGNFISAEQYLPGIGTAGAPATDIVGTGNLTDIFNAAAKAWERVIRDDFALTINYGWYPTTPISATAYHQQLTAGGAPSRQLSGSIAFNNNGAGFFLDPTPYDDAEFGAPSVTEVDLGSGPIIAKQEYHAVDASAFGRVDLFSTAIHEIGHALGLTTWDFYENEVFDGDIDVILSGFIGSRIPVTDTHIDLIGPVLSGAGRPLGYRRKITQVDLLAVCQVSGFQRCAVISGDYDFNGALEPNDFSVWKQAFASTIELSADGNGDGIVDAADYTIWRDQFAAIALTSVARSDGMMAVPEPRSCWLSFLGIISFISKGRYRVAVLSTLLANDWARWTNTSPE